VITSGLRHALELAASEVLLEGLDAIAEDADAFLASGSLGATYQSPLGPGVLDAAVEQQLLADLAAWAPADPALAPWQRLDRALLDAARDLAFAAITQATGAGAVPPRAQPHAAALAPLAGALRQALADGYFDEDALPSLFGGPPGAPPGDGDDD
jgi:hypothetical protein